MKNINFAPSSIETGSGMRKKLYFVLVVLVFLMVFCFVYVARVVFKGERGPLSLRDETSFHVKVEAPKQTEKAAFEKKPFVQKEIDKTEEKVIRTADEEVDGEGHEGALIKGDEKALTEETSEITELKEEEKAAKKEQETELEKTENRDRDHEVKVEEGTSRDLIKPSKHDSNYFIQVCSFVIKENADNAFNKLCDLGYSPCIKEETGQIKMYNIYSEELAEKTKTTELFDWLKGNGYDPILISLPDGGFMIRIASCYYRESARKIVREIGRLGYNARSLKELTQTRIHSVLLGGFESLKAGEASREGLIENGYKAPFLRRTTLDPS